MSQAILQFRTSSDQPRRAQGRVEAPRTPSRGIAPRRALGRRGRRQPAPIAGFVPTYAPLPLVAPNGHTVWAGADRG